MKQKKIFDKVMKIFAVMVFILSMCFSQKYANNVEIIFIEKTSFAKFLIFI